MYTLCKHVIHAYAPLYTPNTPNTPLNTPNTPQIHSIYTLYTPYIHLLQVGVTTGLIGDFAEAFGCIIGLKPSVTAITFVALGTRYVYRLFRGVK